MFVGIKLRGDLQNCHPDLLGMVVYISQTKSIYRNKNRLFIIAGFYTELSEIIIITGQIRDNSHIS